MDILQEQPNLALASLKKVKVKRLRKKLGDILRLPAHERVGDFTQDELSALLDIHLELEQTKLTIEQQKIELERLSHKKQQLIEEQRVLIHILCHDLANPISSIQGFRRLIQPESETKLVQEYLGYINQAAEQGLMIVDLVRKMRAIEEFHLALSPVVLYQAIKASLNPFFEKLRAKELSIEIQVDPDFLVLAESTALVNSVLGNLISNAIKFSPQGGCIRLCYEEPGQLLIEDQGIGMDPKLCVDIFDITKKTSRLGTAGEEGTGFGMPLVKKCMLAFGGKIEVQSKPIETNPLDHGTQFRLNFQTPKLTDQEAASA